MTDELDRLRKELQAAEPRVVARAKGMNAAMAAFGEEFAGENVSRSESNIPSPSGRGMGEGAAATAIPSGEIPTPALPRGGRENIANEKNSPPTQGSDTHRRLTGQNAPRGGAKSRRRSMTSRLPTLSQMMGGSAIAAVLAAFVVLPNIEDELSTTYESTSHELKLGDAQTEFDDMARADKSDSFGGTAADEASPQEEITAAPPPPPAQPAVEAQPVVVAEPAFVELAPSPVVAASPAPQQSYRNVTRRVQQADGSYRSVTDRLSDNSISGSSEASTRKIAAESKTSEPRVYGVRRVAVPGKTATITRRVADGQGGTKVVTETFVSSEPAETLQLVPLPPGSEGRKVAPGNKLIVTPAQYKTINETVVVEEDADGKPIKTVTVQRRVLDVPQSIQEVPADFETVIPLAQNRDRFEQVEDFPTLRTADDPVSTFSIDADTASYSFMRASLNRGQLPDPASIRVEELINYFPYDYAAPTDAQEPFRADVTVTPTPWNADTKLMHIGIKGYTPPAAERPNSNIVLLIDTSGSMGAPNKLPLLINSFKLLLDTLGENDTVSIVTYAGSAGTVLEPTPASERATIIAAFERLNAGGSTAGAAGLELAYDKAQESFDENGINRVILATDGDFNVGLGSPEEMKTFVERKRESGVFLSVLGFGMGSYNDHLMQSLAQNGNGVAAYIDTLSEARKVLADEAGGALIPIAKDVKIQVEFNPAQISEYRLIGYETRALAREDFNNDKVDAGEIGSGHTVTAIYELTPKGSPAEMVDDLRYAEAEAQPVADGEASDEYAFVKIRYKLPDEDTSTLITRPVGALDEAESLDTAPNETRFAASVAALGQMLRGGSRLGEFTYDDVIALANGAKGDDAFGYRAEFVNLVRLAKSLDANR